MANDLTTTEPRQITTHLGAQALRRIARLAAIADTDAEQARGLLPADAAELVEQARGEAVSWLAPAVGRDAKAYLSPALRLVAPAGMTAEDQTAWLLAAMGTLAGIPADLLAKGCQAARLTADHPSKIVPAINTAVRAEWDRRRASLAAVNAVAALLTAPESAAPVYASTAEVAAIKAEFPVFRRVTEVRRPFVRGNIPLRVPTADEQAAIGRDLDQKFGGARA